MERTGTEASSLQLGAIGDPPQANLGGFKSRTPRADAMHQRHLYATEWRGLTAASKKVEVAVLVFNDMS